MVTLMASFECLPFWRFHEAETQSTCSRAGDPSGPFEIPLTVGEEDISRESLVLYTGRTLRVTIQCKTRCKMISFPFYNALEINFVFLFCNSKFPKLVSLAWLSS